MKHSRFIHFGMLAVSMIGVGGCSRHWFRARADRDAQAVIREKGGYLDNGQIDTPIESRLHDPYSIDCPPMPPDDPQSHQLMHFVDGKRGYPHWDRNGRLADVESPAWIQYVPRNDDGDIQLDLQDSIRVAKINSRSYQQNLENLYITALDVTFERFRFDHQFFAGGAIAQDLRGRSVGRQSETSINTFAGFEKLSTTGGEMLVGFANSLVWDSWSRDSDLFASTIDFSLVQPLLRNGGRARVLEGLTQTERTMLANVRQMQQFRQGFFVNVATGRNSGSGPSLSGPVGQAGLGLIAGVPSGRSGAADAGGYMGLLQDQQQIRNQIANIAALRDSLAQLEAAFEANRISSRLQVDQARQALLNAQSSLLSSQAAYKTRVDSFKIELGLPPTLPVEIRDPLLDRFILIEPALTDLQNTLAEVLYELRSVRDKPTKRAIATSLQKISELKPAIDERIESATNDLGGLLIVLPDRRARLREVAKQIRELEADVDPRVYDEARLDERIEFLKARVPSIAKEFGDANEERQTIAKKFERTSLFPKDNDEEEDPETWSELNAHATLVSDLLLELSLVQAETRLQGIVLPPMSVMYDDAIATAEANRLDWMNARANLVDVWRKIEFFANDLESNLDVVVNGQLGTRPDNVLDFRGDNSRLRVGVRFDTPTARVLQQNRYREALIAYQRARRDYMLFEDRITQSLMNTLRLVTLSQINMEVRRTAVQVAIAQVDIARLKLNPPVRINEAARGASPTAARDLVSALSDLLDAQNDFLSVWVSNEVLRILLDFEMGTMQIDPTGMWVDPGPIISNDSELPPPIDGAAESFPTNGLENFLESD
jgi:hypothetical protein